MTLRAKPRPFGLLIAVIMLAIPAWFAFRPEPPPPPPAAPAAPASWAADTAGWHMAMPARREYHAGIAARRVSLVTESHGAVVGLKDVIIERHRPPSNLKRSVLVVTLENSKLRSPGRSPSGGPAYYRYGDALKIVGLRLELDPATAALPIFHIEQLVARFAGDRAACPGEPCYIYLTLIDWDDAGQRNAYSRYWWLGIAQPPD